MNALRTLPILNRPSRPSSPAPPTVQPTTANGVPTQSSEGKPRARSLSRQVTDKAASSLQMANGGMHPPATVVQSQPLGGKKLPSPPNSRAVTPRVPASPGPGAVALPGGGPDPSTQAGYMDVIGLRLNEIVNKACAGVDYKAKKGFKKGNGWSVGESVVKEMPAPTSDAYLVRAVLRTAVRALSIYTTRLESLLLPSLTDPAFASPLNLTAGPSGHPLNPSQHFGISVAHAAWETCEVLEQCLETGQWPRFVQETLRPVMDKLDLVVSKVVQPILLGLKRDLVASLTRTEGTSPSGGKVVGLASIPAPTTGPASAGVPITKDHSHQPTSRLVKEMSQSGLPRQLPIPTCLQHFASRVDGSRKVLELVAAPCADDGEGWITGVVVAVIWKGMCVISEKDISPPSNRPPSPGSVAKALAGLGKEKESTPTVVATASLGGVTAKLASSLSIVPSRSQSRPSSPPRPPYKLDLVTHALMSLEGLVKRLVNGLVQPPTAPNGCAVDPNATEHLAREALHEALEALTSFRIISSAMNKGASTSTRLLASARRLRDDIEDPIEDDLDDAMEDLPSVTLFSVLLRRANASLALLNSGSGKIDEKKPIDILKIRSPAEIWGWTTVDYERQVLSGFSAAEEWGRRYALAIKVDVEKVLSGLTQVIDGQNLMEKPSRDVLDAVEWVKTLGVACEARCGVKIAGAV
ncbi:hypothetical protein CI109_105349 [Kwoniella shandongensis]|uniref:Uncharacterized protein n=1 Tax=Kwoniella shandongensis TaxID=1734106 RepID=A0A5M6BPQ4_9TREE|nr:uncharacterized protein CI109_006934 [Kwoniella shandongensis]KAA5524727.1 hypothetical protein CI109_006934 [Kwoniella shandongensis]